MYVTFICRCNFVKESVANPYCMSWCGLQLLGSIRLLGHWSSYLSIWHTRSISRSLYANTRHWLFCYCSLSNWSNSRGRGYHTHLCLSNGCGLSLTNGTDMCLNFLLKRDVLCLLVFNILPIYICAFLTGKCCCCMVMPPTTCCGGGLIPSISNSLENNACRSSGKLFCN